MKILLVQGHMFSRRLWEPVSESLRPFGIELQAFTQYQWEPALRALEAGGVQGVIANLSREVPGFDELVEKMSSVPIRFGYGIEMPKAFTTLSRDAAEKMGAYLAKLSEENFRNGIKFLASLAGYHGPVGEVRDVRTDGIYHPDSAGTFPSTPEYLQWYFEKRPVEGARTVVGLLCYYGQLVEGHTKEIDALVHVLEDHGFLPVCVFCEGMYDSTLPKERRYPWWKYFEGGGSPEAVLNLMAGRLLSKTEDVALLRELDVPFFQLIRLYNKTERAWREDPAGIPSSSVVYALVQPELAGAIEPTLVAAQPDTAPGAPTIQGAYVPVPERMVSLGRRLKKWVRLRKLPNKEKRITFVLHNAPCRSVEATIGSAVGLDTFESLAAVLRVMKDAGYSVGEAPLSGEELYGAIMARKAISEFRWTTVDEIVAKGGVLHKTSADEYQSYLDELPEPAGEQLLKDWEPFPGQGMVWNEDGKEYVLVTGLKYGNIHIMVQPKRGCYGPKCTGEVCRILHDPQLAPPHHWIATYKYIQQHSDAVVHFGAHGALEFLPGKSAGLSEACFSEISIGDLPNLYPYCMDIPGEGLMAKRRGRAVIVDHLTPVYRPAEPDRETEELADLLEQYRRAVQFREQARAEVLKESLLPLLRKLKFMDESDPVDDLADKATLWIRQIELARSSFAPEGMHVFGRCPDETGISHMLTSMLSRGPEELPDLTRVVRKFGDASPDDFEAQSEVLRRILWSEVPAFLEDDDEVLKIQAWARALRQKLLESSNEIPQLLRALDGKYMEPGLAGSLLAGKTQALPTGRNFFAVDISALPTPAAWEIGKQMADALLLKYLEEENRFPESVAVNLWSIDGFKSDGEVLCQILYLLGAKPLWTSDGRFKQTENIPLDELKMHSKDGAVIRRPRIDVLIQTSGIVRDMLPTFIDTLDHAVVSLGDLDEPDEWNYVRKHTRERMRELMDAMGGETSMDRLRRLAGFRVFSSPPGSYGIGVDLALDASAWQDKKDLTEIYVNWGGHAYGATGQSDAYGVEAYDLYAGHLKNVSVSYMKQYSPEYDMLDEGCYATCQGGISMAAQSLGGKGAKLYWADSAPRGKAEIHDTKSALEAAFRAKLMNDRWIDQMKKHGSQGAESISLGVRNLFKWSAVADQVEKRLFDGVVEKYICDKENRSWLRSHNPYALEEITRRLLEAEARGMWDADEGLLEAVRITALEIEGDMEEMMGEVKEDFQGGKVDILTRADVEKWEAKWRIKPQTS